MAVVFLAGLNCDYAYRLVVAKLEIFGYVTAALVMDEIHSLPKKIITLKIKINCCAQFSDPMKYGTNKRRGLLSTLSARRV